MRSFARGTKAALARKTEREGVRSALLLWYKKRIKNASGMRITGDAIYIYYMVVSNV